MGVEIAPSFQAKLSDIRERKRVRFLLYKECTPRLDTIGQRLNCMCLRFSTVDEVEYTLKQPKTSVGNILSVGE